MSQGAHLSMISKHSYNASQQGEQASLSLPPPPLGKRVSSVTQHHPRVPSVRQATQGVPGIEYGKGGISDLFA